MQSILISLNRNINLRALCFSFGAILALLTSFGCQGPGQTREPEPDSQTSSGEDRSSTQEEQEKVTVDDKRTRMERAPAIVIIDRKDLKKHIFEVDPSVKAKAEKLMNSLIKNFDNPRLADRCTEDIENLGRKVFPALLNVLTRLNHKTAQGQDVGTMLFRVCERMAKKLWNYENEYTYGAFETLEDKWNAIVEMKELWQKHEKER